MRIVDVAVEVADEIRVAAAVANEDVEIILGDACAREKPLGEPAIRDVFALGAGLFGAHFVG